MCEPQGIAILYGEHTMKRLAILTLLALLVPAAAAMAQRTTDTVFIEEMTWAEARQAIAAGKTTAIIATAGTEQNGPHMVHGKHRFILEYTTDKIARSLGNALVAPIITYVPEGGYDPPSGHMTKAGTLHLPEDMFMELLENAARSLKSGGFKDIIFIGDSGGNQTGMQKTVENLNGLWAGSGARAHYIGDYYTKAQADQTKYLMDRLKVTEAQIGSHAGIKDTSEMLFIAPQHVRVGKIAVSGGYENSGVSAGADPTKATAELGKALVDIKINNALAQIKTSFAAR
jgi:creatinine amidohydrolase